VLNSTLRNRYTITRQIGAGGFGETYLAEDLGIPSAIKPNRVVKRLKPKVHNETIIRLFKQEAEVLYKLGNEHNQIPTLLEYFESEGDFFLIQEFVEGEDLSHEIQPNRRWSEIQVQHLLKEILEILSFVHAQNIIHRDIKPANIIRRISDRKLVLIDFGAVKEISTMPINHAEPTQLTIMIGTSGYMPVEQSAGRPKFASDVYAVGMMAIQALTGISPKSLAVDPDTHEVLWQDTVQVSDAFKHFLLKMTARDFLQRYQDAGAALKVLNNIMVPDAVEITRKIAPVSVWQPTEQVTFVSKENEKPTKPIRGVHPQPTVAIHAPTKPILDTQPEPKKGNYLWMILTFIAILILMVASPFVYHSITNPKPSSDSHERAF